MIIVHPGANPVFVFHQFQLVFRQCSTAFGGIHQGNLLQQGIAVLIGIKQADDLGFIPDRRGAQLGFENRLVSVILQRDR